MLLGQPIALDILGQATVATWTAMMVAVSEYVHKEMIAIPATDCEYLKGMQRPPDHWRIWIGRHARTNYPLFTHTVQSFASEKEIQVLGGPTVRRPSNTQTSTICLGEHLIIHVMSSEVAWSLISQYSLPSPIGLYLNQIWPIIDGSVSWPQATALVDNGIDLLANDFMRRANKLARDRLRRTSG
jgi:hypothetical protein